MYFKFITYTYLRKKIFPHLTLPYFVKFVEIKYKNCNAYVSDEDYEEEDKNKEKDGSHF